MGWIILIVICRQQNTTHSLNRTIWYFRLLCVLLTFRNHIHDPRAYKHLINIFFIYLAKNKMYENCLSQLNNNNSNKYWQIHEINHFKSGCKQMEISILTSAEKWCRWSRQSTVLLSYIRMTYIGYICVRMCVY